MTLECLRAALADRYLLERDGGIARRLVAEATLEGLPHARVALRGPTASESPGAASAASSSRP